MDVTTRRSGPLPPDELRRLVLDLEHSGVETQRISVLAVPPTSVRGMSRVDERSVARPASRVGAGAVAGAVLGAALALVLTTTAGLAAGPTIVALTIGGLIIGALFELYVRLPMSTELPDVDTGQMATVEVDVVGLEADEVTGIDRRIDRRPDTA